MTNRQNPDYPDPSRLSRERLDTLCSRVSHSISGSTTGNTTLNQVIADSVEAFITHRGDVKQAVSCVGPVMFEIGVTEANRRNDSARLGEWFQAASAASQHSLSIVVGDLVNKDVLQQLRQDLSVYLHHLQGIALLGYERTTRVANMPQDQRLAELREATFRGAPSRIVDQLASAAGMDPSIPYMAVVAIRGNLAVGTASHPNTLVDLNGAQALVPAHWTPKALARIVKTQVVTGPPIPLAEAFQAVSLTGNAATILRDGSVPDPRAVVPSSDLLGELLVRGIPLLADMLVEKHLGPLIAMAYERRMALSDILLVSLERGLPLNGVAREKGLATQTAHNRMKVLRDALGDKLDDGDQRLEMIVALRSARRQWEKQGY